MGQDYSKMGIAAIAIVSGIEREHILRLRTSFQAFIESSGEINVITRSDFDSALKALEGVDQSDLELLDRLFILLDESGDCKVDAKDFLVGASILVSGTVTEKLLFAFTVFDDTNSGTIMSGEMKKVFTALNTVASFFGDPVVNPVQIKELVIDIFKLVSSPSSPLRYADHLDTMAAHSVVLQFVNGKGTVRFGR
jgi:Ca2+-binding EF-hand superfamily protein